MSDGTSLDIVLVVRVGGEGSGVRGAALFPNEGFRLLASPSIAGSGGMTTTTGATSGVCGRHVWRDS
jgi:hypothetical protein